MAGGDWKKARHFLISSVDDEGGVHDIMICVLFESSFSRQSVICCKSKSIYNSTVSACVAPELELKFNQ